MAQVLLYYTYGKPSLSGNDSDETLKRLSKDTSVTILPADKGRAVVVMDSSDYQQKINGLLQDENTCTKISDRRRNPTPSTEKSLNALLKQIKGQTSAHDPGVQQLDDKLYYTLQSTDATPATFYGLSKITNRRFRYDPSPVLSTVLPTKCPNI